MKILLCAPNVKCPSRKTIQRNSYLILQHPTLLKHKEKGNRKEVIVRETAEPASTYLLDQKATELISALENMKGGRIHFAQRVGINKMVIPCRLPGGKLIFAVEF